jgi:hypothetical protein
MRRNLLKLAGSVVFGLMVLGMASGCEDKQPAKPTKPTAAPATAKPTATATAETKEAKDTGDKMTPEEAAEKMWEHHKKIAKLIDEHGKDCNKLGEELKKYADEHAEEMKKIYEAGGSKGKVDEAMEKKHGDKFEEVSDKILEATEIDCGKDKNVKAAAKAMDL